MYGEVRTVAFVPNDAQLECLRETTRKLKGSMLAELRIEHPAPPPPPQPQTQVTILTACGSYVNFDFQFDWVVSEMASETTLLPSSLRPFLRFVFAFIARLLEN